ncbi:MAG: nuclear transport factor 2 family protein, partial [Cyclobacteriaceae bacterium]|nr:nuclear transport factor 2 family protein [Cyclobacteriaceae bacterium]
MQSCYHDNATFSDPAFRNLNVQQVRAMWQMLITAGKDLRVVFANAQSDGVIGSCDWEAYYSFSKTGRKVHNVIHASFEFSEGKILRHTDSFNLWKWSGTALGPVGTLLGWTPFMKSKIRITASRSLEKFMKEKQ